MFWPVGSEIEAGKLEAEVAEGCWRSMKPMKKISVHILLSALARRDQLSQNTPSRDPTFSHNDSVVQNHSSTILRFRMSLVTNEHRITVKKFAAVPALLDLPEIQRLPGSVSRASSWRGEGDGVDLAEGCLLTKTVKYTHQLAHWVNAVRDGDPTEVVRRTHRRNLLGLLNHIST
jgi:hypothetical protein